MKFKLGRELTKKELAVAVACGARDLKDFVLANGTYYGEGAVISRVSDCTDAWADGHITAFLIAEVLKE